MGIYGRMKIFIGSRMHSNIFALSAGTPCIAIAYEHKTNGIMKMCGLEEWIIPIENIDSRILINKIEELLDNEGIIRERIKNTIQKIKEKSILNALLIRKMLINQSEE